MRTLLASLLSVLALSVAVPALARPFTSAPSCGGGEKDEKKDGKKNPSVADPNCGGGEKDEKKDGKKNPSVAEPRCGEGTKDDKKDDKKPST